MRILKIAALIAGVVGVALISASLLWNRSHQKFEAELQAIKYSLDAEVPIGSDPEMARAYFAKHQFVRNGMADYREQPQLREMFGASAVFTGIKGAESMWTPSFVGCGTGGGFQVNLSYDSGMKLRSKTVKPFFTCT